MKFETNVVFLLAIVGLSLQTPRVLQQDYANNQGYFNPLANPTLPPCIWGNTPVCHIPAPGSSSEPETFANECVARLLGKTKTHDGFCAPSVEETTIVDPEIAESEANGYPTNFGPGDGCGDCLARYNPVCASNGVTYMNLCILKECTNVQRISSGACGATNFVPPTMEISCPCTPFSFQPVCGQDNVTYQNKCVALCAGVLVEAQNACLRPCGCTAVDKKVCSTELETFQNDCLLKCKGKTKLYEGACPTDDLKNCNHCAGYTQLVCGKNGVTYDNKCYLECAKVELYQSGACPSNKKCECEDFYLPVCGLDQKTYKNECMLKCTNVKKAYNGECMESDNRAKFSCASCPQNDQPVCGSDGKTYQNSCKVKCEDGVEILYEGECEPILPNYCDCPPIQQPVCGVDHRTYKNPCVCDCLGVKVEYQSKCRWSSNHSFGQDSKDYGHEDKGGFGDDLDPNDPIVQFLDPEHPPELSVLLKYYEALFPNNTPIADEYTKYQLRFISCIKKAASH